MGKTHEKLLWSIALPGFGQLLNGKYVKGIIFITLEFIVNVNAHFNEIIRLSFLGHTTKAAELADYSWLMFYPCLYFFAMWDAVNDTRDKKTPFTYIPFVFCAYFVTVGIMFSANFTIFSIFPGPVFTPMLFVIPGIIVGLIIKKILLIKGNFN